MIRYAKIRQGFTALVGEVTHEAGVIIALTGKEFEAIAHKVEELPGDVARALHITKGHALAVSPAAAVEAGGVGAVAETPVVSTPTPDAQPAETPMAEPQAATIPESETKEGA